MFFRKKHSGGRKYLQIVGNRWEGGKTRQKVIATLGQLDKLREKGVIDSLLSSGSRFARVLMVISAHRKGKTQV